MVYSARHRGTNAFVYCWTDIKNNRFYVGSHKGSINDGYICSSKTVKKEIKNRPDDFVRQIIAEGTEIDCRILEAKILKSVDARNNKDFYNKHNHDMRFYISGSFSEEHRKKLSEAAKKRKVQGRAGIKFSSESRQKLAESRRKRTDLPMQGKTHSLETKKKMSLKKQGKTPWNKGISPSEETKRKISETLKAKKEQLNGI